MSNLYSTSISERLREIDKQIEDLYHEKHILEIEQQEEWRRKESAGPFITKYDKNYDEIYKKYIDEYDWNEWSGTLGD